MSFRKDIISTFITRFSGTFFAILSSIFLIRLLGVIGKGEYSLFVASTNLFVLLFGFGVGHAITYYVAREEIEERELVLSLLLHSVIISVFFFLIMHSIQSVGIFDIFLPKNRSSLFYELILTGCVFATLLFRNISSILSGKKDFTALNTVNLVVTLIPLFIYGMFFFLQTTDRIHLSVDSIFAAHFGLILFNLVLIFFTYLLRGGVIPQFKIISYQKIKTLFAFAGVTYLASIAQFLNYKIDYWFVNYFTDSKSLGIYSLSAGLIQMVWLLPQSIATVVFPNIAEIQNNQEDRILNLIKVTIGIMLLGGVFSYFFSGKLIPFLYGSEFFESAYIFNILLIGAIPFCAAIIIAGYFLGLGKPGISLKASFIGCFITIILDIILIKDYGYIGAAIASCISYFITSAYLFYKFYESIKWRNLTNSF